MVCNITDFSFPGSTYHSEHLPLDSGEHSDGASGRAVVIIRSLAGGHLGELQQASTEDRDEAAPPLEHNLHKVCKQVC